MKKWIFPVVYCILFEKIRLITCFNILGFFNRDHFILFLHISIDIYTIYSYLKKKTIFISLREVFLASSYVFFSYMSFSHLYIAITFTFIYL
jgi:hypothetical protein